MQGLTDDRAWRAFVVIRLEHPEKAVDEPDSDILAYLRLVG